MTTFRKSSIVSARRALRAFFAAGVVSSFAGMAAQAADLPSLKGVEPTAPMDDGAPMPPPPASLTWISLAPAGGFMLSYNPSFMGMRGNYIGDTKVSDATIATTIPGNQTHMMPGSTTPMTTMMRIVPDTMNTQMHMFNAMYGVTDSLTLMASTGYVEKWMSMTTFSKNMGSTVLGTSSGSTDGLSDTMVGANYRLYQDAMTRIVIGLDLSLPTGSQTRQVTMLSPMGSNMIMRAPYGMQSGTGTWDLMPDIAYLGVLGPWSWGLAYRGRFALDNNSEGYRFGDLNEFHGWGGYTLFPGLTTTLHVVGSTQDHIHGADPAISTMIMSQNADPLDYGGQRVTLLGGVELSGALWGYAKSSIALEAGAPVYQNLYGPQLGQAWQVSLSGRLMF